ncbi:MAG: hypothetical protein ACKO0W_05765 [Planctomycetota bacterium]
MTRTTRTPVLAVLASISLAFAGLGCDANQRARNDFSKDAARDVVLAATPSPARVVAETPNGSIELASVDGLAEVRVTVALRVDGESPEEAEQRLALVRIFAERSDDGTIVVQPIFPGKRMPRDSADLRIEVPRAGDANLRTDNGTIATRRTEGTLRATTKNGAVKVDGHRGSVDASTQNGAVDLRGIAGIVRARSANGAIDVTVADGDSSEVDAGSRNGSVRVEVGAGYSGVFQMLGAPGAVLIVDPLGRAKARGEDTARIVEVGSGGPSSRIDAGNGAATLVIRAK